MIASRVAALRVSPIREFFDTAPTGSINLGLGELQFPVHPLLLDYARQELEHGDFRYTPNAGLPELRAAVGALHGVSASCVCVTNGAEEAIYTAVAAITEPGDEILVADPGYLAYPEIIKLSGGVPVSFPLDPTNGFRVDREAFSKSITPRTKAVLFSHPSNPLGIGWKSDDIDWLANAHPGLLYIVDEVYRELQVNEPIPSFWGRLPNVILVSGVSKSHAMTGWRVGWTIAEPTLALAITRVHQYLSTCAGMLAQRLVTRILTEPNPINADLRKLLAYNREFALSRLPNVLPNSAAPYLFMDVAGNDVEWCRSALKRGVITVPGSSFGSQGCGFVRINYGLPMSDLSEALHRLADILP
jgi:aspartate/methionine/tyrosine aminotransferase